MRTYCAPYGGVNTYRPMFVPDGVGFLRPPNRFHPFTNATRLVPVLRHEDYHSVHFYYHGEGCSDTYIKANSSNGLVVRDRLDALRVLAGPRVLKLFSEWCSHEVEMAALKLMLPLLLHADRRVDITPFRSFVSGAGCLNEPLHQMMLTSGLDTLVLNYEAPGASTDSTLASRKTEIIYLGTSFYDANGNECTTRTHKRCYYCHNSNYSRATCHGQLRHAWRHAHIGPPRPT